MIYGILSLVVLVYGLLYFGQRKFLFFPDGQDFKNCEAMSRLGAEAVEVQEGDVWLRYYLTRDPKASLLLVVFHGNAGSACDRAWIPQSLNRVSVNLVVAEYPGYSTGNVGEKAHGGELSEQGILNYADGLFRHLEKTNETHLPIVVMGESLGTGVATYLASQFNPAGLILLSGYTSIAEVAEAHYPFVFGIKSLVKDKFPAFEWAPAVKCPVLMIHGDADEVIPFSIGRRESSFFKSPINFVEIAGGGHNDLVLKNHGQAWSEVEAFLQAR